MSIYERIKKDNLVKYGTESKKILNLIINQYSDRTHFIYEIIQNAEDAEANNIRFCLNHDSLEIYHNGRLFNERDIEGVCGIANGTKEDGTRIGHFGIGFKSVYCYTDEPKIYSGYYHFKIIDQLFPEEINKLEKLENNVTCFILPFDKQSVSEQIAYSEISNALINKITADSIIMLDHINDIDIEIEDYDKKISIRKIKNQIGKCDDGLVYALGMSTIISPSSGNDEQKNTDYLLFEDLEKEKSSIAYKVGGKDYRQLLPIKNAKIFAFFPTAKEAHQNFYIHAPFDTTPARDNFKEGDEYGKHNVKLVNNICKLLTSSFIWMRDNDYLSIRSFNTIYPIYEYEKGDILYSLFENSVDIINSGIKLLPTNQKGVYKSIENIFEPQYSVVVEVFDDDDLHQLFDNSKYWLSKDIAKEEFANLRDFLRKNFLIKTLDWPQLVSRITGPYLKQKDIVWTEKLFDKIESYCRKTYNGRSINPEKIPFVRTENGSQICAYDDNGKPLVYLNNHKAAKYKIDKKFLENETIRTFYQNALQIPVYNAEQEVKDKILSSYLTSKVNKTIEENIEDLKIIKDAIYENQNIIDELQDKYIVTNGSKWYTPSELYIPSDDSKTGYGLVKDIIKLEFLSSDYFNTNNFSFSINDDFFKKIGCNPSIRIIKLYEDDYLKLVQKYIDKAKREELSRKIFNKIHISDSLKWNYSFEGFPSVFKNIDFNKSLRIAKFLNSNCSSFEIEGKLSGADDINFSGKNVDTVKAYTAIGLMLCFEKWIYSNNSDEPKRPIDIDRNDIRPEYKQAKRFIDLLPFKELSNVITKAIDEKFKGDVAEVFKEMLNNPEKAEKIAKAYLNSEAKSEAKQNKQKNVYDLLKENDKKQQADKKNLDEGFEVNPISEKGIKTREENLEKEFAKSMNQVTFASKGMRFISGESNEEEKQFLLSEYSGKCQICGKSIIKYDGKEYFEAINIVKFSDLNNNVSKTCKYGWNSLCLCPNCAAEYNYCSKKISTMADQIKQKTIVPGSEETIDIEIELPENVVKKIHYSPRHFIVLREAFKLLK